MRRDLICARRRVRDSHARRCGSEGASSYPGQALEETTEEIKLRQYLANLRTGKVVLWCYLIWYLVIVFGYFDPSPSIWLNSLGISAVIGFALILSVSGSAPRSNDRWQTFRLFAMPFCVSSFSALIKGHGFILIFPPSASQLAVLVGSCAAFVLLVFVFKQAARENRA